MSQSETKNTLETKSDTNSLLMPLAIGGGLLLLFMGMNKAKAASKEDSTNELDTNSSAVALPKQLPNPSAQMTPQAAPKYTDVVDSEDQEPQTDKDNAESGSRSAASSFTPPNDSPANSMDTDEEDGAAFTEDNLLPQRKSDTKWNERAATQQAKQQKMNPSGIRQYADQNKAQNNSQTKWNERAAAQQAKQQKMRQGGIRAFADPKKPLLRKQTKWEQLVKANQGKAKPTTINPIPINPFLTQAQKLQAQQKAAQAAKSTTTGNNIFPLKQGQNNTYIKEMQRKLGVNPTGFFGGQTRAALLKKYRAAEVSEALYKQIITGKAAPKSNPTIVKKPIHRPKR